jgi:hypothetical protein
MKLTQEQIRRNRPALLEGVAAAIREEMGAEAAKKEIARIAFAADTFLAGLDAPNFAVILALQCLIDMEIQECCSVEQFGGEGKIQ